MNGTEEREVEREVRDRERKTGGRDRGTEGPREQGSKGEERRERERKKNGWMDEGGRGGGVG